MEWMHTVRGVLRRREGHFPKVPWYFLKIYGSLMSTPWMLIRVIHSPTPTTPQRPYCKVESLHVCITFRVCCDGIKYDRNSSVSDRTLFGQRPSAERACPDRSNLVYGNRTLRDLVCKVDLYSIGSTCAFLPKRNDV